MAAGNWDYWRDTRFAFAAEKVITRHWCPKVPHPRVIRVLTTMQVSLSPLDYGVRHWYITWALAFPGDLSGELLRLSLSRLLVR
jgi:hypothetical protein